MAIIKSYTDLEQSQLLKGILPIESADMYYKYILPKSDKMHHIPVIGKPLNALKWYNEGYTFSGKEPLTISEFCIPAWSLTALLNILKYPELVQTCDEKWSIADWTGKHPKCLYGKDTPIDACVEMIKQLHERKLL